MPASGVPYLSTFVLPPPFDAIVALLMVLGMTRLGVAWARRITRRDRPTAIEIALGFVTVTASVAALAHAVAWCGLALLTTLRILAGVLISANLGWVSRRQFERARATSRALRDR